MTRDLRLVPPAVAAYAAGLVAAFLPDVARWLIPVGVIGAVLLFWRSRSRAGPLFALTAVVLAAVATSGALAMPARDRAADWDGRFVQVDADITSSSSIGADGRQWFDGATAAIGPTDRMEAISVPVRIGVDPVEGAEFGAAIRVRGQVMATDAGERAVLVVFAETAEVVRPAGGVFAVTASVRESFVERSVRLPEPGAGLLPGLAVGDTRAVSPELDDAMLASGLSHLTAVSGANCAIVVAAAFWFVALCGGGRALRVIVALVTLAVFVILVTPEPSVIRAGVMAALGMLSILLGRPSAGVGVLCLACVVILVADPWLAANPGFALSAVATGALILLAPPVARGLERWMPAPLALAVAVPLAAQLACGPIIALFSEQQSLIGIVANMLAGPAAPIATVVGLLACLTTAVPWLADLLTASAWLPAAWISTTARVSAGLAGGQVLVVPGIVTALVVAVLGAAIAVLLWRARDGTPPRRILTTSAGAVVILALALGGARMLQQGPLAGADVPEDWSIAACDVGQGDAMLVRSHGQVALVDTGPEPEALSRCLNSLGVKRIDLLVLTHFDLDHVGAASIVVGAVGTVLHGPVGEPEEERLLADLAAGGAQVVDAAAGLQGGLGSASWSVLWPRAGQAAFPPGNDASLVWEVGGGGIPSALFLGDLSAVPQRMLAASGLLHEPYAVVKVAHHGSADQDAALYAEVQARVALVGVGENDYGHPRAETLDLLEAAGSAVLRTDLHGRVLVALREGSLLVWTERSDVGPDG